MSNWSNWIFAVRVLTSAVCTSDSYWTRCRSSDFQYGLGLERLDKCAPQIEEQIPFKIGPLRGCYFGVLLCAFEAQLAFVFPLMQVTCGNQGQKKTEWPIRIWPQWIELVECRGGRRIGAKECGNLLCARFVHAKVGGAQRGVIRLELAANLLPGQHLGERRLRQARGEDQAGQRGEQSAENEAVGYPIPIAEPFLHCLLHEPMRSGFRIRKNGTPPRPYNAPGKEIPLLAFLLVRRLARAVRPQVEIWSLNRCLFAWSASEYKLNSSLETGVTSRFRKESVCVP